jgi:hypothetical protein
VNNVVRPTMNKLSTMLFQDVTVEQCCNNMLTILFIVGRTTLFTPVYINLEQVVDFLNFYACKTHLYKIYKYSGYAERLNFSSRCIPTNESLFINMYAIALFSGVRSLCAIQLASLHSTQPTDHEIVIHGESNFSGYKAHEGRDV